MAEDSSPAQRKVNRMPWSGTWGTLWQRLTEPGGALPEAERRRARLLSGFLLVLVLTITASVGLLTLRDPTYLRPNPTLLVTIGVAITLMAGYGLNRAGRVRAAMSLTVAIIASAIWAIVIANHEDKEIVLGIFPYLIASVLFSSVLLSVRITTLLMLAHLAAGMLLPVFAPHLAVSEYIDNLFLVGIISALIVVAAILRQQDLQQIERQTGALAESEARFRSAFDSAAIGMALGGLDGRWLQVNPPLCELVGYSEAELLATTFQGITHPDDLEADLNHVRQLLAGEIRSYHMEKRYLHKQGHVVWILLSVSLIREAQERPAYFISQIQDITARKQAEEALRENERRYRSVFEDSPISLWEEDFSGVKAYLDRLRRDGVSDFREYFEKHPEAVAQGAALVKIVDVNTATLALYRAGSKVELLGNLDRIFTPESYEIFREELIAIAEGKAVFAREGINRTLPGEVLHTSLRWSVVPGYEATLARVIVSLIDITERKQAEVELAQERNLLRTLIDNVPDFIYTKDAASRFRLANRAAATSLGLTPEAVVGKTDFDLHPPELAAQYFADEQAVLQADQPLIDREELVIIGRQERWMLTTTIPLHDGTGRVAGLVGIARDITERRQAAQTLQTVNEQLTRSLAELEARTRQISLLNEMGDLLQACRTVEEAYTIIGRLVRELFPNEGGALYTISASRNLVEVVARWGAAPPETQTFAPDECWALRRGRLYLVEGIATSDRAHQHNAVLLCSHLQPPWPAAYLCMPMVAQGEALGVLHLFSAPGATETAPPEGRLGETKQQLARTVADSIALALANLNLRETLRNQSIRDPLTSLFNRRYMEESLEREIHRVTRAHSPLGVIMLDIDHFKRFNDTFGHDAGDMLLREMGIFLQAHVRGEDIACRYGGEEFTLILPEASLEVTHGRAEHLREDIKHLHAQHEGQPLGNVTLSLGVALFPTHGDTRDAVLRAADASLYRAKRAGRDRVVTAE